MQGRQNARFLAVKIIHQLCLYLDLPVGAIFLMSDGLLTLAGTHAYSPSADQPTQFQLGEGVVGEAARQKRVLTLENLPAHYSPVAPDTDEQPPRYLLIQPIIYNGDVLGVIELGSQASFTPHQGQFLQMISEDIAIAFYTAMAQLPNTAVIPGESMGGNPPP